MAEDPDYWAKRAFDRQDDIYKKHVEAAIEFAKRALQAGFILNGGAFLALLVLLASILGGEKLDAASAELAERIIKSLTYFAFGAFFFVLATCSAYLINRSFAEANQAYRKSFEHPYIQETSSSKGTFRIAVFFYFLAVASVGIGLFLFFGGIFTIRSISDIII